MFHLKKFIIVCLALSLSIEALPQFGDILTGGGSVSGLNSFAGGNSGNNAGNNHGNMFAPGSSQHNTGTNIGPGYVAHLKDHSIKNYADKVIGSQGINYGIGNQGNSMTFNDK